MFDMKDVLIYLIWVIILIVTLDFVFVDIDEITDNELQEIENQIVVNALKQYERAKGNTPTTAAYTQARMVAVAFLLVVDYEKYKKWKEIEKEDIKNVRL